MELERPLDKRASPLCFVTRSVRQGTAGPGQETKTQTPRAHFPLPGAAPPHFSFLLGCAVGIAPEIYYIWSPKAVDCLSRLTPETL